MSKKSLLNIISADRPFENIKLYNPSLKELFEIIDDEDELFFCLKILTSSFIDLLNIEITNLEREIDDFEIFINLIFSPLSNKKIFDEKKIQSLQKLLLLILKDFDLSVSESELILRKDDDYFILNKNNYKMFQSILKEMFCLDFLFEGKGESNYNPAENSKLAKEIAEKLRKSREKINQINSSNNTGLVLENYLLIVSIGLQIPLTILSNYNLYQLFLSFNRVKMKLEWDLDIDCRLAGGDPKERPENWMSII